MTYSSRSCMMPVSGGSSPNDRPVPVVRRPRRLSVYSHRQHELRLLQRCFQFYYLLYPASHRTSANYYSATTCPFLPYFWPFPRRYEGDEALNVSWRRSSLRSASNYHARGRLLVERESESNGETSGHVSLLSNISFNLNHWLAIFRISIRNPVPIGI
jgi:hypothetical protein